mgnify:CR=1 FL=1
MKPDTTTLRVLVVDDDHFMLGLVSKLLTAKGYEVLQADHGETALEIASQEPLDLILLDVLLPGDDGYAICRRIKAIPLNASVPVIFLTGMRGDREMLQGFKAGGVDYVVKPFESEVLLARVKTHTDLFCLSRSLQAALRDHDRKLAATRRRMRELNDGITRVRREENRRLARTLNGRVVESLRESFSLLGRARGLEGEQTVQLARAEALIQESLEALRRLSFELDPPPIEQVGLFAAMEALGAELRRRGGPDITCRRLGTPVALPPALEITLYQVIRELILDAAPQPPITDCALELSYGGETVELVLRGKGGGFEQFAREGSSRLIPAPADRAGLTPRVEVFGGTILIKDCSPNGTEIRVTFPLDILGTPPQA